MREKNFRFRDLSCDFVDRRPWGKIRSTKSHEAARKQPVLGNQLQAVRTSGFFHTAVSAGLKLLLLVLLLTSSVTWLFAARRERLIDSWKPLHYSVSLTLNDQLTEITSATAEITVLSLRDTLSQIDLDFGE